MRIRVRSLVRSLAWGLVIVVVLLLGWLAALASFGISRAPAVPLMASIAPKDIERALQLLKRHDPRWQRPGIVRAVVAEERDVNLLLAHAASRVPGVRGHVSLLPGAAELRLSVDLMRLGRRGAAAPNGNGWWLNLHARLGPASGLPELRALRIGPVPVPTLLAEWAGRTLLQRAVPGLEWPLLNEVIRRVELREGRALVFYAWQEDTGARLLNAMTPAAEQERLRAYAERLATWSQAQTGAAVISMPALLQPLAALALQRGAQGGTNGGANGGDLLAEARAALFTATLYATRRSLASIVPAARGWPKPRSMIVTLANRTDTPLHYLISAALAAESGSPLADAVGLYKELADARAGGSGFSFNDLAADRAGTRLGELAVRNPKRLLGELARGLTEAELLPDIADLPESLTQAQFEERYGGVGAPAYARMVAEIEARLQTVPLLR